MEAKNTGGPAFPAVTKSEEYNGATYFESESGMTLRDYFAAKAMHQFLHGSVLPHGYDASKELMALAERAYEVADAMLKAREAC